MSQNTLMRALKGMGPAAVVAAALLLAGEPGEGPGGGTSAASDQSQKIIIPESSRVKPGDKGKRAHTNYEIRNTRGPITPPKPSTTAPRE